VPAAVNERDVATDLLEAGPPPPDLLADKGLNGAAFAISQAAAAQLLGPAHRTAATIAAHTLLRLCLTDLAQA
jgi:hypothetical protein